MEYVNYEDILNTYYLSELFEKKCKLKEFSLNTLLDLLPDDAYVIESDINSSTLATKLQFQRLRNSEFQFDIEKMSSILELLHSSHIAEQNSSSVQKISKKKSAKNIGSHQFFKYQYFSTLAKFNCDCLEKYINENESSEIQVEDILPWLQNILTGLKNMRDIRKTFNFDFLSVYRISDIIYRLVLLKIEFPQDFKNELLTIDILEISLESSCVEIGKLFDKKRPQVVAMWSIENSNNFRDQVS